MTLEEEQAAIWRALLAAVKELTRSQPDAYEYGMPGSDWWAAGHGSSRSAAIYSDDGRAMACTFDVGEPGGTRKTYRLSVHLTASGEEVASDEQPPAA